MSGVGNTFSPAKNDRMSPKRCLGAVVGRFSRTIAVIVCLRDENIIVKQTKGRACYAQVLREGAYLLGIKQRN